MWAVLVWIQILGGLLADCQAWVRARVERMRETRISFLFSGVLRQLTVRPTRLNTAWALLRDCGQWPQADWASQWICWGDVVVAGRAGARGGVMGVELCLGKEGGEGLSREAGAPGGRVGGGRNQGHV